MDPPIWNRSSGVAHIKSEYIDTEFVRELDTEYLNAVDREKLERNGAAKLNQTNSNSLQEKIPKLKGRNKNRKNQAFRDIIKVCSFVVRQQRCPYGEKCRYSHKIEDYVASKSADLGIICQNILKRGYCPYGFTCRFSSGHINADGENINVIPEGLPEGYKNEDEINVMRKGLQQILRKRNYDFSNEDEKVTKKFSKDVTEEDMETVEEIPELDRLLRPTGSVLDEEEIRARPAEKKCLDFREKLFLSPLTTVGNLPFRRICKGFGADITCGEMALASNLLSGQQSEWALMVRHKSEDLFGVQVCGGRPDMMEKLAHVLNTEVKVDFVDINCGCPIDLICKSGSGCALMGKRTRMEGVVRSMSQVLDVPLTVKMRVGIQDNKNFAHEIIPKLKSWGASLVSLHGRSRDQRYTKSADWNYITQCAEVAAPMPLFGNGDCMNFEDYYDHMENSKVAGILIARGALIKPWIFTEIKERRHWDISPQERLDIFKDFVSFGLEHWGSDTRGVENVRRFLLEWLSFTHRYIPVGLLEVVPQRINERPPHYHGRSDLETLLSSSHCRDWIKISEVLLGPVPDGFTFLPKHKANAWK